MRDLEFLIVWPSEASGKFYERAGFTDAEAQVFGAAVHQRNQRRFAAMDVLEAIKARHSVRDFLAQPDGIINTYRSPRRPIDEVVHYKE